MDPLAYNEVRTRPSLEERLESIISGAALMADSSCTRDERRERIVAECNAVRQALQDLLSEYMSNVSSAHLCISSYRISSLYCCLSYLYLWKASFKKQCTFYSLFLLSGFVLDRMRTEVNFLMRMN